MGAVICEQRHLGQQVLANRNLLQAVFRERDADGVAEAVAQQRADAYGAFDAALFAFTGLSDAEVKGVVLVVAEFVQARDKQPVALDHHLGIARLHGEQEVVEGVLAGDGFAFKGCKQVLAVAL
jgi:hypothetical protein